MALISWNMFFFVMLASRSGVGIPWFFTIIGVQYTAHWAIFKAFLSTCGYNFLEVYGMAEKDLFYGLFG
jgi:hypothetical protein